MKKLALHWQLLIAFVLAVIFGLVFKQQVVYVAWTGTLFMRALKMLVVPLILSSIISGVANIGSGNQLGKISIKTFSFYVITSIIALITGLVLVNLIKPGVGADLGFTQKLETIGSQQSFTENLMSIIPDNIFAAMAQGQMLGLIFFAIVFGFFITRIPKAQSELLTNLFNAFFSVMMQLTLFIIKFTPIGLFGIVAQQVAVQTNLLDTLSRLGLFAATVVLGLFLHGGIIMPLIIKLIGNINPIKHLKAMKTVLITAFSTASSNATLPLTMEAIENEAGVSNKISSFTLPLGATINMNGTALYELVSVIFIAQAYGISLTLSDQIIILITGLLTSIGAAGIPMASLVMITLIMSMVGIPLEGIGLILAIDRLIDMFRTAINVWGDTCCAVVVAKTEGETLKY